MNRFTYAEANPWTFIDPSGHSSCGPDGIDCSTATSAALNCAASSGCATHQTHDSADWTTWYRSYHARQYRTCRQYGETCNGDDSRYVSHTPSISGRPVPPPDGTSPLSPGLVEPTIESPPFPLPGDNPIVNLTGQVTWNAVIQGGAGDKPTLSIDPTHPGSVDISWGDTDLRINATGEVTVDGAPISAVINGKSVTFAPGVTIPVSAFVTDQFSGPVPSGIDIFGGGPSTESLNWTRELDLGALGSANPARIQMNTQFAITKHTAPWQIVGVGFGLAAAGLVWLLQNLPNLPRLVPA